MRLGTPRTIVWTDGTTWTVDDETFRRVTEQLDAVRSFIAGLDPIYARWTRLASQGEQIVVDDFAPSEDDRAVLTAALDRAAEDARASGPSALGFDDPAAYSAYMRKLSELHQLFVTDVTYSLPKRRR